VRVRHFVEIWSLSNTTKKYTRIRHNEKAGPRGQSLQGKIRETNFWPKWGLSLSRFKNYQKYITSESTIFAKILSKNPDTCYLRLIPKRLLVRLEPKFSLRKQGCASGEHGNYRKLLQRKVMEKFMAPQIKKKIPALHLQKGPL